MTVIWILKYIRTVIALHTPIYHMKQRWASVAVSLCFILDHRFAVLLFLLTKVCKAPALKTINKDYDTAFSKAHAASNGIA
jgi:hypothetical protein